MCPRFAECVMPDITAPGRSKSPTRWCYQKIAGQATTLGQKYEFWLSGLVYLRMLETNTSFQLGNNMAGLGAFDDMFVKLETGAAYCIQLKHKEQAGVITTAALINEKGKFGLLKYYQSYCEIEDAVKSSKNSGNSDILKCMDFDDFNFIIYTNSPVDHETVNKTKDELSDVENLLTTGDEKQAIFSFGSQDTRVWQLKNNSIDEDRYHKFLSKLKIFSSQGNAAQVFKLVERDVANYAQVASKEARTLSSNFLELIEKWWEQENYFLTERSAVWYVLLREQINCKETDKLEEVKYRFQPGRILLMNSVKCDSYLNVVVPDVDEDLRCLKIWTEVQKDFGRQYLLMSSFDIVKRLKQVKSICKQGFCEAVIINTKCHEQHFISLLEPGISRIILISGTKLQHPKCHAVEDIWHMDDLTQDSQEHILKSIIEFQGHEVTLSKVSGREMLLDVLNGKSLATLMKGENLSIGRSLPALDDFYITRTLHHHTVLNTQILNVSHKDDIIAVSHFPHQLAQGKDPCVVVMSMAQHSSTLHLDLKKYQELCERWKLVKNVHWVAFEGDFLTWKESYGSIKIIHRYISVMSTTCKNGSHGCYHVDNLPEDWKSKLRLITGQPGMGKSTLLKYLASYEKRRCPHAWMLLISLNNCTKHLNNMSPEHVTLDQVIDMLFLTGIGDDSVSSHISKKLLFHSLKSRGNISLFLDAVDEISPTYKELVMKIIQLLLQNTGLSQLWVTSRTVLERYLQKNLLSLPLVLQPFAKNQQVNFLREYLVHQGIHHDVETIADHLIQLYGTSEHHLYDVPLHAQMAADMFVKQHQQSPTSAMENKSFISMNLHELYENFFIMKHDIYYSKYNFDPTSAAVRDMREKQFQIFMDNHITCALLVIFSDEQLTQLNIAYINGSAQQFLQDIEKQRIGIIEKVHDDKPHFVHISFADYLVALWFQQKYEESKIIPFDNNVKGIFAFLYTKVKEVYKYIFEMIVETVHIFALMFEWKLDNIRLLFDHMVAGKCELHQAVLRGNLHDVNILLESGLCVGEVDSGGRLALHLAASHGRADMVKMLLKFGCVVNISDSILNWRPLRYADNAKAWEIVVILLRYDFKEADLPCLNCEIKEKLIRDSIKEAARADNENTSRVFHNLGFDLPLYNTIYALHLAIAASDIQLVQKLIQHTFNSSAPGLELYTPLHEATECDEVEAATLLINHNADVNAKDGLGCTSLHIASRKGNSEMVTLLLESGADVGAVDNCGSTALHLAALKGHYTTVQMLLIKDAPVEAKDDARWTPLLRAAWQGHYNVVKLLLEHGGDIEARDDSLKTALHRAAWEGQMEAVRILLENGAHIEARDRWNITPLLEAASEGHKDIVRLLLEEGADQMATSDRNRTALHRAVFTGHLPVVQVLLDFEGDLQAKDDSGRTALHLAASKGHSDIVQLLLQRGANTEVRDSLEWTALHRAVFYGHLTIVRMLLDSGANLDTKDNSGNSPLEIAVLHGKSQLVRFLQERKPQH